MSKHAEKSPEVIQPKPLAVVSPPVHQDILSSDVVIPKLLLLQGLSEFVQERKGQQGDIVRSTTVEKLAEPGKLLDFIPLKVTSSWSEKEQVGGAFEYRRTYPRTRENEHLAWDYWRNAQGQEFDCPGQLGATAWKRVKSLDVFALLPRDIDAFQAEMKLALASGAIPDLNKVILPVVISFRSTSYKAGTVVTTFLKQVEEMQQDVPSLRTFHYTLPLGCKADKSEKGAYFVFEVGQAKALDEKYRALAEKWTNTLNAVKDIKIDSTGDSGPVEGQAF